MVKADKDIRPERLKNEPEKMDQYLEFVFSEADVSVVIAVNYDTIRLERLKSTPERMEEHRKFKKGSAQKAGRCRTYQIKENTETNFLVHNKGNRARTGS